MVGTGLACLITVDEARAAALEIQAQAKKGIDPRDADARRKAEPIKAELGRRFLEEYVPTHCKPSTQGEYRPSVEIFIDPAIGKMRISEVARKDIAKLHFDLRDKPYQANRTLGVLSKMFSLAEVWGLRPDGSNPSRHVKRYKENKRERFLSPEEAPPAASSRGGRQRCSEPMPKSRSGSSSKRDDSTVSGRTSCIPS